MEHVGFPQWLNWTHSVPWFKQCLSFDDYDVRSSGDPLDNQESISK